MNFSINGETTISDKKVEVTLGFIVKEDTSKVDFSFSIL